MAKIKSFTSASWSFLEFPKYTRGKAWYVGAGVVGAILIAYAFFTHNFLFALIVVMMALIIFLQHTRSPKKITCSIGAGGIKLARQNFAGQNLGWLARQDIPWNDITKFWIIYQPPEVKKLYLATKRFLMPQISVPLEQQNPVQIRELLLKYLPEDLTKENESNVDTMSRILKW